MRGAGAQKMADRIARPVSYREMDNIHTRNNHNLPA